MRKLSLAQKEYIKKQMQYPEKMECVKGFLRLKSKPLDSLTIEEASSLLSKLSEVPWR